MITFKKITNTSTDINLPTQHYSPVNFSASKLVSRSRTCRHSPCHFSHTSSSASPSHQFAACLHIIIQHNLQTIRCSILKASTRSASLAIARMTRIDGNFQDRRTNCIDSLLILQQEDGREESNRAHSYKWELRGLNTSSK